MNTPQQSSALSATGFQHLTLEKFLDATAAKQPTPGGGAVAGCCGALAAALGNMVVAYSLGKKNLAQHQELLTNAAARLHKAREILIELANEDAQAYALVNELQKLPEGHQRREDLPLATLAAAQIPLAAAACALDLLRLFVQFCTTTNPYLRSDLAIAAILADATVRTSRWNVEINLPALADPSQRTAMQSQISSFTTTSAALTQQVEAACRQGW